MELLAAYIKESPPKTRHAPLAHKAYQIEMCPFSSNLQKW
jgi:hypothetical protein